MVYATALATIGAGDRGLYWNGAAISYLVEALLAAMLAVMLLLQIGRDWRQQRIHTPTFLLVVLNLAVILTLLATLARTLVAGGWLSYAMPWAQPDGWMTLAMPWAIPFGGLAIAILVQLSYVFPQLLPNSQREGNAFALIMAAVILAECYGAVHADMALMQREIWWRPGWLGGWMVVVMIWGFTVQWRQLAVAYGHTAERQVRSASGGLFAGIGTAMQLVWRRPANREASVARGMMLIAMLPVLHTVMVLISHDGEIAGYPIDIFFCWSALSMLTGFALIFLGYLPEKSSFLFKLTIIGSALAFAAIAGSAWIVGLNFERAFRPSDLPLSGQSLRLEPRGDGGYTLSQRRDRQEPTRIGSQAAAQSQITLPFALPFYGRQYRRIYVDALGSIGFDRIPKTSDAAFAGGAQPAIFPLLVRNERVRSRITTDVGRDFVAITREDLCAPATRNRCLKVRTVLHADGGIDIDHITVPNVLRYRLFDPLSAPWLSGAVPGWQAAKERGARPALRDYYLELVVAVDRLLAPLVGLTLVVAVTVLIGLPLMFRGFLVQPLNNLITGMRQFRQGRHHAHVPVTFNDEIGYLTESFNEMAQTQRELVETLEQRVTQRTAEAAAFAARSAQLEERGRISADLHDTVSQTMFSAAMLADQYARTPLAEDQVNAGFQQLAHLNRLALDEMRLLLVAAQDGVVTGSATAGRLTDIAAKFESDNACKIDAQIVGDGALPANVTHAFCQIAREALNNVAKHALANRVTFSATISSQNAVMTISDNGSGFDPATTRSQSLGMQIMHDRARQIGAALSIESNSDAGTTIQLAWEWRDGE